MVEKEPQTLDDAPLNEPSADTGGIHSSIPESQSQDEDISCNAKNA